MSKLSLYCVFLISFASVSLHAEESTITYLGQGRVGVLDGRVLKLECLAVAFPEDIFLGALETRVKAFGRGTGFEIVAEAGTTDRYGALRGDIITQQNTLAQSLRAHLVEMGLARIMPWSCPDNARETLLRKEMSAQQKQLGLWAHKDHGLQSVKPSALKDRISEFHVIQGKVLSIGQTRRMLYLNFGTYWKEDFTVTVAQSDLTAVFGEEFDPQHLKEAVVQVRGWIEWHDGPMIQLKYPGQLYRLDFQ